MKGASIYMKKSTDMMTPDGGKAKATLGATAHATFRLYVNIYRSLGSHYPKLLMTAPIMTSSKFSIL